MTIRARPKETKTLHFDLTHLPTHQDFTLHAGGKKHPLRPHTSETLDQAKKTNKALALIAPDRITHYVPDVELPADAPMMIWVSSSKKPEGAHHDTLALTMIHLPSEVRSDQLGKRREWERAIGLAPRPDPKLEMYGIPAPSADLIEAIEYDDLIKGFYTYGTAMDAAITLVLHHPEMMSLDATKAAIAMDYIAHAPGISDLAQSIHDQAKAHAQNPTSTNNWVNSLPATGADLMDPSGQQTYQWSDTTKAAVSWPGVPGPLKAALQHTKNDSHLRGWSYTIQPGTTCVGNATQTPPPKLASFRRAAHAVVGEGGASLIPRDMTPQSGVDISDLSLESGTFSINLTNEWIRWLSVYVQFLDTDSKTPIAPEGWTSRLPTDLERVFETDTIKYIDLLSARDTILGIPIDASPKEISFPWPTNNPAGVQILCGGLGVWHGMVDGLSVGDWDTHVCTIGAILTGILNFGLPMFYLAAGAALSWAEKMDEEVKAGLEVLLPTIRGLIEGSMAAQLAGGDAKTLLVALANCALDILLKDLPQVFAELTAELTADQITDAVPFVGWIAEAISIAADVAVLTETTVEVLSSAATITIDVNKVMDVTVTVNPDSTSSGGKTWPAQSDHYVATLQYTDGTSYQKSDFLDPTKQSGPISVIFESVPAGGSVKAIFAVYSAAPADWLCGKGETDFLPAPVDETSMAIPPDSGSPFCITQFLVPLTVNTQYEYRAKLVYDSTHHWAEPPQAPVPTATLASFDRSTIGQHLAQLVEVTFSQRTGTLGYVWQAAGLNLPDCGGTNPDLSLPFTFQNITVVPQTDQVLQFPNCGLPQRPTLVYDLLGPQSGTGLNFWFDPRHGGNYLRQVILDGTTPFNLTPGQSWGRFNEPLDALAIHPAGYVVGISNANHKLEVLQLPSAAVADATAPVATLKGGLGSRVGLLHSPVAVVVSVDGRILVLEQAFNSQDLTADARIQALDLYGNPVNCFAGSTSSELTLKPETAPVTYMDMGVESKGYLYVLKYLREGSAAADYLLDLYQPDGTYLMQTAGVAAGKLAVSLWRDVYTLNYELLAGPGGRPEPSISWWSPAPPNT